MDTKPSAIQDLQNRVSAGDESALAPLAHALDEMGKAAEATELLSVAANRGSLEGRYLVGSRLLMGLGAPAMPQEGLQLIAESTQKNGGAAHLLGVLCALGAFVPRDWPRALSLLQLSAELGLVSAQRELTLLASDRALARAASGKPTKEIWSRLAASISVAEWAIVPHAVGLSEAPQIVIFPGLFSTDICNWLIDRCRDRLKRARVYLGAAPSIDDYRSNTSAEFGVTESDFVTALVQTRLAAAAQVELNQLEALSVLHYAPGERFADHYDFVDPKSAGAARDVASHGQRIFTLLTYLNEEYSGGETAFPRVGITHKGTPGEGLLLRNVLADGSPDLRTLHAGVPPSTGEKWIATQFIRSERVIPGTLRPH